MYNVNIYVDNATKVKINLVSYNPEYNFSDNLSNYSASC